MRRHRRRKSVLLESRTLKEISPMIEEAAFRRLLNRARLTDQQYLRKWADLMGAGYDLHDVAALPHEQLIDLLKAVRTKNLSLTASMMARSLCRLGDANPDARLPRASTRSERIQLLPIVDLPKRLQDNIAQYSETLRCEIEREGALAPITRKTYVRLPQVFFAAATRFGVRANHSFGIEMLVEPKPSVGALEELDKRYRPYVVSGIGYGTYRMAAAIMGREHRNVERLRADLASRYPGKSLDVGVMAELEGLLGRGIAEDLSVAPQTIMARAQHRHLKAGDRISRASISVLLAVKLSDPALTTQRGAGLRFGSDLQRDGCYWAIRRPGRSPGEASTMVPLPPATCDLIAQLQTLKGTVENEDSLLFPGRDGLPRETRAVMAAVYGEIELVTGQRLTFGRIRDLYAYAMLNDDPEGLLEASEALGYRHSRSLELRMQTLLRFRRSR